MRAVFQEQRDVSHVYSGSRRDLMRRLFTHENEPFFRSAKVLELGRISEGLFATFVEEQFARTDRGLAEGAAARLAATTGGHPYATQELAYALWEEVPEGFSASNDDLDRALRAVLRSENAHFSLVWDSASRAQRLVLQALAVEPGGVFGAEYRRRHDLPAASSVQRAVLRYRPTSWSGGRPTATRSRSRSSPTGSARTARRRCRHSLDERAQMLMPLSVADSSIAASSSAEKSSVRALPALSSSCATLEAPISVEVRRGSRSVQASAICASDWPRPAQLVQVADLRERLVGQQIGRERAVLGRAGALRDAVEVLVGEHSLRERREARCSRRPARRARRAARARSSG